MADESGVGDALRFFGTTAPWATSSIGEDPLDLQNLPSFISGIDPVDLENLPATIGSSGIPRDVLYGNTGYGPGMTGDQTSRYDTALNLTGSKDLANIAASGDVASLLKNVGGAAKNLFTSPGGVAALGAILGAANRPKPTGGGTTMAYPGAAKLERKMVQGPYGPLAEYTGVGGGAPDYTPFTAPTFGAPDVGGRAPTPAPSPGAGMSVQSKVDLYKQMAGYGLAPDRIRRIAETMYGAIPDSDWAELTRLAGVGAGIAAPKPGGITTPAATKPPAAPAPAPAAPAAQQQYQLPSWAFTDLDPTEKAALYNSFRARGFSNDYIRQIAERSGAQTDKDWSALEQLALQMPQNLIPGDRAPTKGEIQEAVMNWRGQAAPAPAPAAPAPVAAPTPAAPAAAPEGSEGYRFATQPGGIGEEKYYENIANFIRNNPDEAAQKQAQKEYGISDVDVYRAKLRHNLLGNTGFYASPSSGGIAQGYAHGGLVHMEDGGFVLTKRAVDGAGGPRGIAQLVPGARPIRGPGTGTSDSIPATIQGRHGQTPAKVSNGEAYVPKRFVQAQGGPQRMYALMNQLQRKA